MFFVVVILFTSTGRKYNVSIGVKYYKWFGKGENIMIKIGKIITLIILALLILSIFYPLLEMNDRTLDSIVENINNASVFVTIICVFFAALSFLCSPGSFALFCICIVDIVLSNDLYRNDRIGGFIKGFSEIKRGSVLKFVVAAILIFLTIVGAYIIYKIYKGDETSEAYRRNARKGIAIVLTLSAIIALCGVMDYLFFEVFPLDVSRPKAMEKIKNGLHYVSVIGMAVFFVFLGLFFSLRNRKIGRKPKGEENVFRKAAFFALILVIITIVAINKIDKKNIGDTIDNFITAMTDNAFLAIILPVILFFIYQILLTILLHALWKDQKNKNGLWNWVRYVENIEKGLLKAAYNIVNGCIQLLEFIPDFFDSINVVFLGYEDRTDRDGSGDIPDTDQNANSQMMEKETDGKEKK